MKKIMIVIMLLLLVSPVMAQEHALKASEELKEAHPSLFRRTLIEVLVDIERSASEIYKIYAKEFPELKDFWNELALDEERHARMVAELPEMNEEYKLYPYDNKRMRFNEDDARNTLNYIKNKLSIAQKNEISLEEALNTAVQIEKSLVEREFYTVFEGDGPAAIVILKMMVSDSERHEQKVRELIKSEY